MHAGNVYGILPMSTAKQLSIYLMLVHQVIAFCLYSAPLYYMSEKLFGVHTKSMPLKLLARLPVCKLERPDFLFDLSALLLGSGAVT
jgi:auxin influx carrier (AUX1 LAX family)